MALPLHVGYSTAPIDSLGSSAAPRHQQLFEPIQLGPKRAPNRFWTAPYATGWTMEQIEMEAAHRGMRAEGGWGVVNTGECAFDVHSRNAIFDGIEIMDDADARRLAKVAEAVHRHGSLAGIELIHLGAAADPVRDRVPALAPSQMLGDDHFFSQAIPKTMEISDIERVQRMWVAAARRARDAGFDIVTVHSAHGYLPVQFLTEFHNRRTDTYGGSLANRARFLLETLEGVRTAVGDDMAISVRFAIESHGVGSLGIDDALRVVEWGDPYVDIWDVAQGGLANTEHDLTPSRLFAEGYSLPWSRRVKEATKKLVVGTARLTNPDLMASILKSGDWDFVGAARPGIADPFLPRKIALGGAAHIRECIGANHCARTQGRGHLTCSQNPTTGEEHRRSWHPEQIPAVSPDANKPVLVIGAGPAGIETAVTLARSGFDMVHLVDGTASVGGHLRWFAALPGFHAWYRVIEHRMAFLDSLPGVTFIPGMQMSVDDVLEYGAELVVVATGAPWATIATSTATNDPIPGADARLPWVATPEQLINDGKILPGNRIAIYDCEGDVTALGLAQWLQRDGCEVEVVTPYSNIGDLAAQDNVGPIVRGEILQAGGQAITSATLRSVAADHYEYLDARGTAIHRAIDGVVLITRRASDEKLFLDLSALGQQGLAAHGISAIHRAGDCISPVSLADAVFSGHQLGRALGGVTA